jgi:hypothetical protein
MKKLNKLVSVFGLASVIAITTARGQFSTITVDELGGGFYNGAPVASAFLPDPFNGGTPGFAYLLPFIYTYAAPVADILLFEPGGTNGIQQPSDLLRFTRDPNGPNTLLFFYSDASSADPADAPADVLVMPNPVNIVLATNETGLFANPYTEAGPNGYVYVTGPGGPGSDGNPVGTQYTFISDVPEPSSFFLLSAGFGILCGFNLLRRKVVTTIKR